MTDDREPDARHPRDVRDIPSHRTHHHPGGDLARSGLDPYTTSPLDRYTRDFDALMHLHAELLGGAGIAPHDRVVPRDATARVPGGAEDRLLAAGDVELGADLFHARGIEVGGLDPE